MRPQIVKIFVLGLSLLLPNMALAQSPPPPTGPPPPGFPIDANIAILLFLGLVYGVYVAYKRARTS
jgi:hypothetical protein